MSIITTFENQCRALTGATSSDENASRFIVGTLSPCHQNLIYLFEYKDDNNNLAKVSFTFPYGESWHLSTSARYPNLFASVVGQNKQLGVSLFKLPPELENPIEDDYGLSESSIEKVFDSVTNAKNLTRQSHWHPDDGCQLLTCNDGTLQFWNVNEQKLAQEYSLYDIIEQSLQPEATANKHPPVIDLRWSSLFNCSVVAAACGPKIYGIDTRISQSSLSSICWLIEDQRCNRVRSIDFNPNSQYYVASGGDDCRANFWDLRQTSSPVLHMQSHTHWIWSIRYNPFHDQLVLSAGSDARVSLMRVQSIASEPYGQIGDQGEDEDDDDDDDDVDKQDGSETGGDKKAQSKSDSLEENDNCNTDKNNICEVVAHEPKDQTKQLGDEVVKLYEEHDDSVYAVEWASDPWIFASLGLDSRLVINKVPKSEKFSILF